MSYPPVLIPVLKNVSGIKPGELLSVMNMLGSYPGSSSGKSLIMQKYYSRALRGREPIVASGEIQLDYEKISPQTHRYRTHHVRAYLQTNTGRGQVNIYGPLVKKLDAWCTDAFGRGYKKPLARWYRHNQSNIFTFKDAKDASAFRFYFHQMLVTEGKLPHEIEEN